MTRNELYAIMQSTSEPNFQKKLKFMETEILSSYPKDDPRISDIKRKLSVVNHQFKQKWLAARKTKARFEEKNADWLSGTITIPCAGK